MNGFQPDGKYSDTSRFSTLKTFPTDQLPPQSILQRIASNYGQQISHSNLYAATSLQQVDIQSFLQLLVKANAQINIIYFTINKLFESFGKPVPRAPRKQTPGRL